MKVRGGGLTLYCALLKRLRQTPPYVMSAANTKLVGRRIETKEVLWERNFPTKRDKALREGKGKAQWKRGVNLRGGEKGEIHRKGRR